jgi:hypothetical protein
MTKEHEELEAWAAGLTERQLSYALYEFRNRKFAAAVYDFSSMTELFDIEDMPKAQAWFEETYETVEEVMCEAARDFMHSSLREIDALGSGSDD